MSGGGYDPRRVAVLISGFGSNLQALLDAAKGGGWPGQVCLVVSDQGQAYGLERARRAGVATVTLAAADFPDRSAYDTALGDALEAHNAGLIVLAGFMRILGEACVNRFAGRMLNVHPSLLPRFRGLRTHARALEAGDSHHGATVHFVTAKLDGGPRVIQYRIPVRADDTPESLSARVQAGEHIILPRAAGWFAAGRLTMNRDIPQLDGQPLTEPLVVQGEEQP